jgi:predicted ATPase
MPIRGHSGPRLSPFVGRHQELATLQALLAQAEAGRGQVVGVVGEPGLGKSRLFYEFRHSLRERRLTYLAASCLSYGQAIPYGPMRALLRRHCGISEHDPAATICAKVYQALAAVGVSPDEVAPYLLHLLGVPGEPELATTQSPQAIRARTVAGLVQLALQGARRRPLVLEVENLQWLDPSSEEVLTALVERLAGATLLLLVSYRPGYRLPWLDKSYVTQVALRTATLTVRVPSPQAYVHIQLTATPLTTVASDLDDTTRAALIQAVGLALRSYVGEDGLAFPQEAHVAVAHP